MAEVTWETNARNAACDGRANLLNGGVLRLKSAGGTTLADIELDGTNAFEAAGTGSAGVARAIGDDGTDPIGSGNPLTGVGASGASTGTAVTEYELRTSGGTVVATGDVGAVGSGASVEMINVNIAENQPLSVTSLSIVEPATVTWTP